MRILPHPLSNRYSSRSLTCVFTDIPFSARTFTTEVHAFSPSPHFPHVQLLQQYMRFLLLRIFRTYNFRRGTCGFLLSSSPLFRRYSSRSLACDFTDIPFYARTFTTEVHAFSPSPHFPHVQLPQWYIRFRTHFESFQIFSYDSFNIFNV